MNNQYNHHHIIILRKKNLSPKYHQILDPRKKLEHLRKAMIGVGVSEDYFDKAWGRLAATQGSLDRVVDIMKVACENALDDAASGNVVVPVGSGRGGGGEELEDMD